MKKFYILLVAVFTLTGVMGQRSIPALSVDASALFKHPTSNLQHRTLNPLVIVQDGMNNAGMYRFDVSPVPDPSGARIGHEMNPGKTLSFQTRKSQDLIQLFDSIYQWQWDTTGTVWSIKGKTSGYIYDANHNLTNVFSQIWNGGQWVNSRKTMATYDAANNQTSWLSQKWNGSVWVNIEQILSTYDASNNMTIELGQDWNGSVWVNYAQITYTYDTRNNCTSTLTQKWDGSQWVNYGNYLSDYDANNNMLSYLVKKWEGSAWVNSLLINYTYDARNNLISYLVGIWNGSAWVNLSLTTCTYDVNNNQTSSLYQSWNGSAWVTYGQSTYTYNVNNKLTIELDQIWNGNAWLNSSRLAFTYDANDFRQSSTGRYWDSAGARVIGGDSAFFYYHTVLGINDVMVQTGHLTVYPNPASDYITIETTSVQTPGQLSIVNLDGQQLITFPIPQTKTRCNISSLPGGVYFVRLKSDKAVLTGKFIKQ